MTVTSLRSARAGGSGSWYRLEFGPSHVPFVFSTEALVRGSSAHAAKACLALDGPLGEPCPHMAGPDPGPGGPAPR